MYVCTFCEDKSTSSRNKNNKWQTLREKSTARTKRKYLNGLVVWYDLGKYTDRIRDWWSREQSSYVRPLFIGGKAYENDDEDVQNGAANKECARK